MFGKEQIFDALPVMHFEIEANILHEPHDNINKEQMEGEGIERKVSEDGLHFKF